MAGVRGGGRPSVAAVDCPAGGLGPSGLGGPLAQSVPDCRGFGPPAGVGDVWTFVLSVGVAAACAFGFCVPAAFGVCAARGPFEFLAGAASTCAFVFGLYVLPAVAAT